MSFACKNSIGIRFLVPNKKKKTRFSELYQGYKGERSYVVYSAYHDIMFESKNIFISTL